MKTVRIADLPVLDTPEMVELDRAMMEDMRIELIQMMENAGRNLAHLARERFLAGDPCGKRVLVLAGSGGNGGGALVAARRLHIWGAEIRVALGQEPGAMTPIPAHQREILERMRVAGAEGPAAPPALAAEASERPFDLILDGLIGYSLRGPPTGLVAELIRAANALDTPILALDIPSGVDSTSGELREPAIRAAATLTLALPKRGLIAARAAAGELYLADISVPTRLYAAQWPALPGAPIFAEGDIVRLV
jgi:NAD(P)H-hydrate epimerase